MKHKPKVSVIVPIYNVEKYLRQCLDSVVNQTLRDIEIICVNDGSPDKCPQIADEYAARDDRIIVIHQPNGGYGVAVNKGIAAATGEYVAIVEPDDFIDSNMYQTLYETAKKNNTDVVKSAFYIYYDIAGRTPYNADNHWFPKEMH
jgi:glycosyltransferase involved in cell wall biosynthesis